MNSGVCLWFVWSHFPFLLYNRAKPTWPFNRKWKWQLYFSCLLASPIYLWKSRCSLSLVELSSSTFLLIRWSGIEIWWGFPREKKEKFIWVESNLTNSDHIFFDVILLSEIHKLNGLLRFWFLVNDGPQNCGFYGPGIFRRNRSLNPCLF